MATIVYWEARGSTIFDTDDPKEAEEKIHVMLSQAMGPGNVDDIEATGEVMPNE